MWFTRLAIARPLLIWMALAAIAVLGIRAYTRLPAELNPRTDIPTLVVTTVYAGAGPPEIEMQISKPLEESLGTAPGIKEVTSSSQPNVSILMLEFQVGTNLDSAMAEVRSRIDSIRSQMPAETQAPVVSKLDINALPVLHIGFSSETRTIQSLRTLADDVIRPSLERVPGVAVAQVIGGVQREIQVSIDGNLLAQYGLTTADVVNSLKAGGRDIPGGNIQQGSRETDVRLTGAYSSLNAIRTTQILSQSLMQRQAQQQRNPSDPNLPVPPLTIADVASVRDGMAERTEINRINGREGVSIVLTKASDANTVKVVDGVEEALKKLELPADVKPVILRDDAATVRAALEDVNVSLVLGAFMAMIVILFFLHNLRGTLIVALAIPSCMVATFLVLWLVGFTLNQMTLLALSLSVGILVDDSIVVLESITRHLKNGESAYDAAVNGRAEIGFADMTTTLVDVVVFVPIGFMGGVVGGFFKEFGLTIATATLFSLIVSFSVTPMLAARWYKSGEDVEAKRGIFLRFERFYRFLEHVYRNLIEWALHHRAAVIFTGISALALTFMVSFTHLGSEFMPGTDQSLVSVTIEMPPGSSLSATDGLSRRVEQVIREMPEVSAQVTNVGQVVGGFGSIPHQGAQFAQINLFLREKQGFLEKLLHRETPGKRSRSDETITDDLRKRIAPIAKESGGRIVAAAVRSVQGISAKFELQLRGADMEQLTHFAEQARDIMATMPQIIDPDISIRSGKPEIRAEVDRNRAAQFGIAPAMAGTILRDSIAGNTDTVYRTGKQEFKIRVELEAAQRSDPADVAGIPVGSDTAGQTIRLADVATLSLRSGPTSITRNGGLRMISLTGILAPNVALEDVLKRLQSELATIPHEGITLAEGGEAKTINENIPYFVSAFIMAILLVYIVMAALFNSMGTPFVIMFTLPMALVGAFLALVITGDTLSLVSGIGIIMLLGLMGRNAILLLDYANTLRGRGMERNKALAESGATRLRPILMTTTATIVGMLPVAMRIGQAAEVRAPMAIVVIGGLIVSTMLTLIVIPVLYSIFDDWFGGLRRRINEVRTSRAEARNGNVTSTGKGATTVPVSTSENVVS